MTNGRLFIPRRAAKKELRDPAAKEEIVTAWRKGIFAELPAKGINGCRLLKAYVTTARGPRRTLYLFPSVYRFLIEKSHYSMGVVR